MIAGTPVSTSRRSAVSVIASSAAVRSLSPDQIPSANPDGSAIQWVQRNGRPHSIHANWPDPDGLAVFPVGELGALGDPMFQDAGASSPWCPLFLNRRPNELVLGYGTADGLALATLDSNGTVSTGPLVPADNS